jgi:GNAT superfamily N-acetyltransferase
MPVQQATRSDFECVLKWLKSEYEAEDHGFWSNRIELERALACDEFWVVREAGFAIAFQVGRYSPRYLNVRHDHQGKGLGSALVAAMIQRARNDDANVLIGECEPRSSYKFWQKHGFQRYGHLQYLDPISIYRILVFSNPVPVGMPQATVNIDLLPPSDKLRSDVEPIEQRSMLGVWVSNDEIAFPDRYIATVLTGLDNRDIWLRIHLDGQELCCEKAKHLRAVGVLEGRGFTNFYVDKLKVPK